MSGLSFLFLTLGGVLPGAMCAQALAISASAEMRVASVASSSQTSRDIPEWKLDETFNPASQMLAGANVQAQGAPSEAVASSMAQDQQRCPIVKLPIEITLACKGSSWHRQWGGWSGMHGSAMAEWGQSVFHGHGPDAVYVSDADGRQALKALWLTEEQLRDSFGWSLDISVVQAPKGKGTFAAMLDCEGELLFVVLILAPDFASGTPQGGLNVYDRAGGLVARTMEGHEISRQQFVDDTGYLLAISESPGLNASVPRELVPADPSKGDIRPFGLRFELGGYEGASRLLEVSYRYVIAFAVQLRAIYEASPASFPSSDVTGKPPAMVLSPGSGGLSGTVGYRPGDISVTYHIGEDASTGGGVSGSIVAESNGVDSSAASAGGNSTASGFYSSRPSRWVVTFATALPIALCFLGLLVCLAQSFHGLVFPELEEARVSMLNPFITLWDPGLPAEKRRLLAKGIM